MSGQRPSWTFWTAQLFVLVVLSGTAARLSRGTAWPLSESVGIPSPTQPVVDIPRTVPLRIEPLFDDPSVVSDDDLAAVLRQVQPRFPQDKIKPNFVEHALRIWSVGAAFRDPAVMSGPALRDFLTDHGKYLASWGPSINPLLLDQPGGVSIRWGRDECASVHHDHWLACLTEAGAPLDERLFTPAKRVRDMNSALQQALRDFRVDEREVEWSALAFGLWLPPVRGWTLSDGRRIDFDLIARRLMRGAKEYGVCLGTHRVYSLAVLWRLHEQFDILSPEVKEEIEAHLLNVRELIIASQCDDGHWPSNWDQGKRALEKPVDDLFYKTVIATGHHLEWLAIMPEKFHPPREQIHKAAAWAVATTKGRTPEQILEHYTFFSHVGGALASWRKTRPSQFWKRWEAAHPEEGQTTAKPTAATPVTPEAERPPE